MKRCPAQCTCTVSLGVYASFLRVVDVSGVSEAHLGGLDVSMKVFHIQVPPRLPLVPTLIVDVIELIGLSFFVLV